MNPAPASRTSSSITSNSNRIEAGYPAAGESVADVLASTSHRPWPLPRGSWIMSQTWHDLAFLHWPVTSSVLRPYLPGSLEIDTFEGQAWIAVVPFWMSGIRLRAMPPFPFVSRFIELNVRTYVRHRGRPGVLFLTLDAPIAMMNCIARQWFHLPYRQARMMVRKVSRRVYFESTRIERAVPRARFIGDYEPIEAPKASRPGSLEHWLTERYGLFAPTQRGDLITAEIHHRPWPLQRAHATIHANSMATALRIPLPESPPIAHYAEKIRALVWRPHKM